jgi:hypothetical protein
VPEPAISRVLFPVSVTLHGTTIIHLWVLVAQHLLRPTRKLGRAILKRSPIWSCSRWGLPSFPGHPGNWCALTAPFHPYPMNGRMPFQWAVSFLWHFPSCHRDSALRSTLPCGARTFLPGFEILDAPSDRSACSDTNHEITFYAPAPRGAINLTCCRKTVAPRVENRGVFGSKIPPRGGGPGLHV